MQIAWPYSIGKNINRCIQIYFYLADEYCQNATFVVSSNSIKMLCVQQGFSSKPLT